MYTRWLPHSFKKKKKGKETNSRKGYHTRVCERLYVEGQVDVKKFRPFHFPELDTNDPHCAQLGPVHKQDKK